MGAKTKTGTLSKPSGPAAKPNPRAKAGDGYVPMRDRFKAWWNGDDVEIVHQLVGPGLSGKTMSISVDESDVPDDVDTNDPWCPARLAVIQAIWGDGFIEPGGNKVTKNLLGWLGLNSRQSVLDLTAGIGGTARSVAAAHNLWMDALESVPTLATEGRRLSVAAGLGRQVPIASVDLEKHYFAKGRYDAIYSRERLFSIRSKARLLTGCAEALKKSGQILITDYMRAPETGGAELAACWGQHEKETPNPWTMKAYVDCLTELGMSIHIAQDISVEMTEHINSAWRRVPQLISEGTFNHSQVSYLIKEGELWLGRLRALEDGKLIVGRIHAQRSGN